MSVFCVTRVVPIYAFLSANVIEAKGVILSWCPPLFNFGDQRSYLVANVSACDSYKGTGPDPGKSTLLPATVAGDVKTGDKCL